jgi:hypothetical protein
MKLSVRWLSPSDVDELSGLVVNIYIGGTAGQRSAMAPALAASEPEEEDSGPMTKSEANYRRSALNEDEYPEECSTCQHYSSPGGGLGDCQKVAGTINPEWVCDYYEPGVKL